ncbi:hypothetical protein A2635_00290 [Candidatus Peribacteria bacterium RIFCSPHIGHO2_01_FULL_51_9]|nr:MAG: hypothetical protein A2635_00290 [Candidatus Peribacteria bacterium RIFCSPHIGHO2_01_FULL_51_9]
MKRKNKWGSDYMHITACQKYGGFLGVSFANGDRVKVPLLRLTPAGFSDLEWDFISYVSGGHGHFYAIRVPARPCTAEISWETIRCLTDKEFAKEWARLAEEQTRHLGARLKELRQSRGFTQKYVAEIAGLEPANVSRVESGKFNLLATTLWKILAAMGYNAGDLAAPNPAQK